MNQSKVISKFEKQLVEINKTLDELDKLGLQIYIIQHTKGKLSDNLYEPKVSAQIYKVEKTMFFDNKD